MTFNEWWNADTLTYDNPYEPDSAAYWAWEGYQAAVLAEREKAAKVCMEQYCYDERTRRVFAAAIRGMK